MLKKTCAQINRKKRYYDIEGIFGLGRNGKCSVYEANKDKDYYEENLIAIGSACYGEGRIYLDYSECGTDGEPGVIAIDRDCFDTDDPNPKPVVLADNFEDFIKILREYDEDKEVDVKFVPDDKIHKLVKKKVLLDFSMGFYIFFLVVIILTVIGYLYNIFILKLPVAVIPVLAVMMIIATSDIRKREYKCWYDEIEEIKEENGIVDYVLKDTDRKMTFIVSKKEKINVGDRFLCITDGYAFKYDEYADQKLSGDLKGE
jgi:hypothetical protein